MRKKAADKIEQSRKKGFTLLELSIVLVVIGLLVGGVLVGKDLIHAAEIRAQVTQIEQYKTAYNAFMTKYNCIPGDCDITTASQLFHAYLSPNNGTGGNGNGLIEWRQGDEVNYSNQTGVYWAASAEYQLFFTELVEANLINDTLDQFSLDRGATPITGSGMPHTKLSSASRFFVGDSSNFNDATAGRTNPMESYRRGNNAMWFVICQPAANQMYEFTANCGVFIPSDTKKIDQKIDDGMPFSGKFMGFGGFVDSVAHTCISGTDYDLTQTTTQCQAVYVLD